MRLSKLELSGFKSFARRTELDFAQGITAVIGPNGSGKSNIADSIRWVLGEQSAKSLRGGKMEDVIFAGTAERKSQGCAEVTLTFDNSDGLLGIPYTEVAITRRLYRNGESEYCINNANCRLKDVQDLFRDTGIGKDGYSIISQGRVDEILSNKSNERRTALEEAAGVMHFRVRKEEAVRKLDHTEKNLERIEDILRELSERVGPLEEQSRTAREYLKLRDSLKGLEISRFLDQYVRLGERIEDANLTIAQFAEREKEAEIESVAAQERVSENELRAEKTEAELQQQQNLLMEMLASVESFKGETRVLTERCEHAQRDRARLEEELESAKKREAELILALDDTGEDKEKQHIIGLAEQDVSLAEKNLSELEKTVSEAEEELEKKKNSIMEAMNRLADARADASRLEAMSAALRSRMESIRAELEPKESDADLEEEYREALGEHEEKQQAVNGAEQALETAKNNKESLAAKLSETTERARTLENETGSVRSRLQLLTEMAKNREGYYQSVKNVMRDAERDPKLSAAVIGVVAELIRVPKVYETAIDMALGSAMQNIVTPTAEDAKFVIEYLRKNDYGRATLLPIALLRNRTIDPSDRRLLKEEGVLGLASELVGCDESIRAALDHLLGHTVIVKDLESGIRLKKKMSGGLQIATLEGDIISGGGAMSGGSARKQQLSLIGREREIRELTDALKKKQELLKDASDRAESLRKEVLLSELQTDAFRTELEARRIELAKSNEKLELIRHDIENENARRERLEEELASLTENLKENESRRAETNERTEHIETGNTASREDVRLGVERLNALRNERNGAAEKLTERRIRLVSLRKEQDAWLAERKRLETELENLKHAIALNGEQTEQAARRYAEAAASLAETENRVGSGQTDVEAQRTREQELETEKQRLTECIRTARAKYDALQAELRDIEDKKHRQELLLSRTELERQTMQDRLFEDYELTYENAKNYTGELPENVTAEQISHVKNRIRELGDINVSSIEEYKAVSERFEALSVQRDDLRSAMVDLGNLVDELTDTMEKTFEKQFEIIRKNFSETFSELFGGGQAELRLADKENVLDCDIDIIAQPPGKKLQLLSLLSGGERALTAIALLFAMLRLKPPAFCVLDEIESSLDEANVSRYADYLKRYSEGTQFIIITHRKGSMEVCDSLYGVSMEERGVSKIVSARFGEENQLV